MKPFLKYRGGKTTEIKYFQQHIPQTFDTYYEPFVGGGAVFFHLNHRKSVINDINEKLMKTYWDIKNNYHEVRKQLDLLQDIYEKNQKEYEALKRQFPNDKVPNKNEELYYKMREEFNHPTGEWLESVVYFFINKTSYSGMIRYNKQREYNVPFGRYKTFNTKLLTEEHSHLLKRTDIYNGDYSKLFSLATSSDFMFLDPPYDCIFSDYGNEKFTGDFDEDEHRRLAQDFKNLDCMALMIISKTPLTTELYNKYVVDEYHKNYSVNIRNRFKNEAKHLVIRNFDPAKIKFNKEKISIHM
ncbi:DNA adenine methylase [Calidifontibacillus erzurumensis]|uniref:site-specific DNA-methyltransferase (adenine-specific) n=1 Tax=Calidifontibacillus erzurumensis TaxID=2741433 RepID=A0A8J8GF77_9BACI|nr:Dam family site-specific DNA-(adenine-N6)-methyltransferase [Calidifontibacillus erzurumensis]NSL52547.1 Dam family site-specific DNA-(adenine-N6)-methyltransferase [Calidifontibacillus erzurumensis]